MLCFVVVMQSFIMNSHEVFIHIHQGCFAGTGAIVRLPQCQWSKPDGYGKISQCITTTKHSKAKTVCIFLGIYCKLRVANVSLKQRVVIMPNLWSFVKTATSLSSPVLVHLESRQLTGFSYFPIAKPLFTNNISQLLRYTHRRLSCGDTRQAWKWFK